MTEPRFQPLAAILALILPGLGYVALGEVRRALYIAIGIFGLIFGGVLIGGIDAIDRKEDPLWFGVQALAGPVVIGLDWVHQSQLKITTATGQQRTPLPARPGADGPAPTYRKSLARVNDVGMLYVALAGMLNLIAIVDCAWREGAPRSPDAPDRRRSRDPHKPGVRIRRAASGGDTA